MIEFLLVGWSGSLGGGLPKGNVKMEDFEIIEADAVERTARGRKPNPETLKLAEALLNVKVGQAVLARSMSVDLTVGAENVKTEKARIGSQIRSAANHAGRNVKIHWTTGGVPQVIITK